MQTERQPQERCSWLLLLSPPAILACALVPLGSAPQRALHPILSLACLAMIAIYAAHTFRGAQPRVAPPRLNRSRLTGLLFLPALLLVQLVLQLTLGFGGGPIIGSVHGFALLTTLAGFFVFVQSACLSWREVRILTAIFVAIGFAEAAYGLLNLFSGNERLLLYARPQYHDSATGTLVGRAHFALLMEMVLPLALALALTETGTARGQNADKSFALGVLLAIVATVISLALIFSRSRMALVSLVAAGSAILLVVRTIGPRSSVVRAAGTARFPIVVFGVLVLILTIAIGLDQAVERFGNVSGDFISGRLPIWESTLRIIASSPLLGHGWGSFETLLLGAKPRPTRFISEHAHNDYLELLAETGIVGLCFVLWLIGRFARTLLRYVISHHASQRRPMIAAYAVAITTALVHSTADFGLRIPGVAFAFVFVVALFDRAIELERCSQTPRREPG